MRVTTAVTIPLLLIAGVTTITAAYAQESNPIVSQKNTPNGQEVCYQNGDCWLIHPPTACKEGSNPPDCINTGTYAGPK